MNARLAMIPICMLMSACAATHQADHAVASVLGPAVDMLNKGTDALAKATGNERLVEHGKNSTARAHHEPPPPFKIPARCVVNGSMRIDDPQCAMLNQALYDACVYTFRDKTHAWWVTKPECKALYERYRNRYLKETSR